MDIKEVRKKTGLSQRKFAEEFGIPVKTLQGWEIEKATPPSYVVNLIEYAAKEKGLLAKSTKNKE